MSNIVQYTSYAPVSRLARAAGRELARIDASTNVKIARVESQADVQAAHVDAVALVAQRAMQSVAFVSQMEQQLGQAVPLAVTRLQAIGDLATLGVGQVVTDTVTKLRRL